jgi:hypothetical protein
MTTTQAHQFVGRWRRIFIPWPSPHTDGDSARALERSFLGIAVGPLIPFFMAVTSGSLPLSHWPLSILIPAGAVMLLSYWLSLRFRVAHRLLLEEDEQHLSDVREHIYDKPSA